MKREHFTQTFNDFVEAGNKASAYYVTYRATENIKSQRWGKVYQESGINPILEEIEQNAKIIQGELPIERLIVYGGGQCLVFAENKLWDCVNDESEDSHTVLTVPYISDKGGFGVIVDETENPSNVTSSQLTGELAGIPLGVVIKMLERQREQQGKENLYVFAANPCADRSEGGFDWNLTKEGDDFWSWVLEDRMFDDVFFKEYPEYKKYDS